MEKALENTKELLLPHQFYQQQALTVARQLLGALLVRRSPAGMTVGKIVETEAYGGPEDKACHAWKGMTERTRIMFGPGGYAYVYFIYGMYHCFNIVTGSEGDGQAVLIRAIEPLTGLEIMSVRRNTGKLTNLCSGPGKLCQALAITRADNGVDLCSDQLQLLSGEAVSDSQVSQTPRKNVDYAAEAKLFPWRFIIKGSPFVS
jgi:DNA-3-methyladenine glycosylase